MNVQLEVNGLGRVDFALPPFGWVRNIRMEFCGEDDEDLCHEALTNFMSQIQPEPYENIIEEHVEAAAKDLQNALQIYLDVGGQVVYTDTICITIRPIAQHYRTSTPEEVAEFIAKAEAESK